MINLICDIEKALQSNHLRVALGMALTLPDICGQIEYPTETNVQNRYVGWCDKFLFNQGYHTHILNTPSISESTQRVIAGDMCYKLRCAYLHAGNTELNSRASDSFPVFKLQITHKEDEGLYSGKEAKYNDKTVEIRLDIRHLTHVLCNAARKYYEDHSDKVLFEPKHIEIIDIEAGAHQARKFFTELRKLQECQD